MTCIASDSSGVRYGWFSGWKSLMDSFRIKNENLLDFGF